MYSKPDQLFRINHRTTLTIPNTSSGTYMNDGIRKIDFILVSKIDDNQTIRQQERRKFFEDNLEKEGIELETERTNEPNQYILYVKVHLPWKVLCKYAEELQIKSPLWLHDKPLVKKNSDVEGQSWWKRLRNIQLADTSASRKTRMHGPSTTINWPFKRKRMERHAIRDQSTFFTEKQRIEIAYEVLQQTANDPKEPKTRGIEVLLEQGIYETAYPLHDGDTDSDGRHGNHKSTRQFLKESWASWKQIIHLQPLYEVRSYFGEKIGFYFAFMDCYTRMLIFPSVVGLLTFIIGLINAASNPELSKICNLPTTHSQSHHMDTVNHDKSLVTPAEDLHQTTELSLSDPYNVAGLTMCPICKPPGCDAWEMTLEGCTQYTWAYRIDNPSNFVLSAFTIMWAIIFLKIWKRREASLAAEWDTEDAEEQNLVIRPDYEERAPTQRRSPVTLETEPFIPLATKSLWISASVMATVLCLLFACLCLILLVLSRIKLYGFLKNILPISLSNKNVEFARWIIHGAIFIVVLVLERAYHSIAHKLTAYECPRTQNQFMSSLLWKIFIFELLNDFVPIAYAAWIKGKTLRTPLNMDSLSELCDGGCMGEVTELVAVLLLARLVIGNLTEVGFPFMKNAWKRFRLHKEVEKAKVPQWLKDFHLNEVELDGVYDEYMEMMVQFAFIVLFIPALPVAAFVCFLNNIAEIRVDAINMLQAHRRPLPIRVSGIGIWNQFLDIIAKSGIICNAALLAFTSDNIPRMYYTYIHSPGYDVGFTKFSLSSIPIIQWGKQIATNLETNMKMNFSVCWYPDLRKNYFPFDLRNEYWEILSIRMVVFAMYCITFFVIMFLVNTFVSDVPNSVKTKIRRRIYVVTKSMEAEAAINQSKWAQVKEYVLEDSAKSE